MGATFSVSLVWAEREAGKGKLARQNTGNITLRCMHPPVSSPPNRRGDKGPNTQKMFLISL